MAQPVHVSVEMNASGGANFETARAHLLVQYGNKEAHIEVGMRGVPEDVLDYGEQRRSLLELIEALEAWRARGANVYTDARK